jgi:hypothetical protein
MVLYRDHHSTFTELLPLHRFKFVTSFINSRLLRTMILPAIRARSTHDQMSLEKDAVKDPLGPSDDAYHFRTAGRPGSLQK